MTGLVALTLGCAMASMPADTGYIGVDIVKRPEGLFVWRVLPGPLDGGFVESQTLARGDLILSIDGVPASTEAWDAIASRPIGTKVTIEYQPGEPRGADAGARWTGKPVRPDAPTRQVTIAVDDGRVWRGSYRSGDLSELPTLRRMPDADASALPKARAALGANAHARTDQLLKSLAGIPAQHGDPATNPLLRSLFADPSASEGLVRAAIPPAEAFRKSPFRGAAQLVLGLAGAASAPLPEEQGTFKIEHPDAGVWYLDFLLNGARARFIESVGAEECGHPGLKPLVVERLDDLLVRGPHSRDAMLALKALPRFDAAKAAAILAHFDVQEAIAPTLAASEAAELPEALKGAVEGTIIAASEVPELGWLVVGGLGPNSYDLGRVAAVLELGGDDRYRWNHRQADNRLVVDLGGDDVHTGGELGPAAAVGAIAIIDDRAGNDRYEGGALTAGSSLGIAAIIDRAGDDSYSAGPWSLGAAAGGAAVVVDLGGSDRIACEGMGIGVGGPSAVGAFVDLAGDDRASLGTRPSVYQVAGEHAGFGMGLGLGFRLAAAGGAGAYIDFEGRDQRESGEFSQGCGYYLGLGVLLDGSGDDVSTCDRYGIGSAAHQAVAVAIDLGGNDCYIGRTAAHVGAAWDESLGYFVDAAGDDSYRVDSLSLGAAAQQALGIAIDRGGADQYRGGGATIGSASGNEYHFDATGLGSFAVFLDLAGFDLYPSTRGNDRRAVSAEEPADGLRDQDSAFIDEASGAPR